MLKCLFCNKIFPRVDLLTDHLDDYHKDRVQECIICKRGAYQYGINKRYYRSFKGTKGLYYHCINNKIKDGLHLALAYLLCGGKNRRKISRMSLIAAYEQYKKELEKYV